MSEPHAAQRMIGPRVRHGPSANAAVTDSTVPSRRIRWPKPSHDRQFPMCFGAAPCSSRLQARNGSPSARGPRFTAGHHHPSWNLREYRVRLRSGFATRRPRRRGPGPGLVGRAAAVRPPYFRPRPAPALGALCCNRGPRRWTICWSKRRGIEIVSPGGQFAPHPSRGLSIRMPAAGEGGLISDLSLILLLLGCSGARQRRAPRTLRNTCPSCSSRVIVVVVQLLQGQGVRTLSPVERRDEEDVAPFCSGPGAGIRPARDGIRPSGAGLDESGCPSRNGPTIPGPSSGSASRRIHEAASGLTLAATLSRRRALRPA